MKAPPYNPPAFPREDYQCDNAPGQSGMSLRDWFATMAPRPRKEEIDLQHSLDRSRNPHNDSYKPKIRSRGEIEADLRYRFADAMLATRAKETRD